MIADDRTLLDLVADAQILIDTAHNRLLEDGVDTFADAYRDAFTTLCAGIYDITGRTE
ncbi:hypothetical protein [Rhodococcus sp. RDE2]|uniref:hypothetical protein n=1 Tax=Rhodococcus sp. RDE2 TaxID=2885078 RepID=UPI001E402E03|nr:hypothetical protein [Rhodococcus sp. RDE2]BDB62333.1 hypothetical protein RDE2_41270 [Rhodococcus sp. RDE2]